MRLTRRDIIDTVVIGAGVLVASAIGSLCITSTRPVSSVTSDASGRAFGYVPLIAGEPLITWPCNADLDVAVNLDQVPVSQRPDLLADIDASLDTITAASPYRLERTRMITVIPTEETLALTAGAAGVDLVIAVDDQTRPDATDLLTPGTYGTGGLYFQDLHAYVGWAFIDTSALRDLPAGNGARSHQALITHELLHALGLGHSHDPGSLMRPKLRSPTGAIGDVDIAGLGRLNLTACAMS